MIGWIDRLLMTAAGAVTSGFVAKGAVTSGVVQTMVALLPARRGRVGVWPLPPDDPAQLPAEVPIAGVLHEPASGIHTWGSPEAI